MEPIHGIFIEGLITKEAPPPAAAVPLVPAYVATIVENLATNSPAPQLNFFSHAQIGVPPVPSPAPCLLPPFIPIHQRGAAASLQGADNTVLTTLNLMLLSTNSGFVRK